METNVSPRNANTNLAGGRKEAHPWSSRILRWELKIYHQLARLLSGSVCDRRTWTWGPRTPRQVALCGTNGPLGGRIFCKFSGALEGKKVSNVFQVFAEGRWDISIYAVLYISVCIGVCCIISAYSTVLHEVDNDVEIIRLQYQYFDDTGTVLTMTLYQDMDNSWRWRRHWKESHLYIPSFLVRLCCRQLGAQAAEGAFKGWSVDAESKLMSLSLTITIVAFPKSRQTILFFHSSHVSLNFPPMCLCF